MSTHDDNNDDDLSFLVNEDVGPEESENHQQPEQEAEEEPEKEPALPEEKDDAQELGDDADEQEDASGKAPRMFKRNAKQGVYLEQETVKELAKSMNVIALALFNMTAGDLNENADLFNPENLDVSGASEEFADAAGTALAFMPGDSLVEDALQRTGSDWRQVIESEHGKFGMSFKTPAINGKEKLTGADATYHMRSALGLSRPRLVACVHSGFWVELGSPKLGEVATLMQEIAGMKDEIGRHSKTPMLSNSSVFIRERLIDFILAHVVETNFEHPDVESLRRVICLLDYPALIMGMATTMWPNGYEYHVPCIDSEMQCRHINKFTVFLNRTTVIDNASMTDDQKKTMAQRRRKVTEADVEAYKAQMLGGEPERTVVLHDDGDYRVSVVFRHPVLEQHLFQGRHWIAGIQEKVAATLANASAKSMDEMAEMLAGVSFTREHSHWVKEFIIDYPGEDKPRRIDEYDDVMEQLEQLVENDDALSKYADGIKKYITDCVLSVTGIPRTKCSKCGTPLGGDEVRDPLAFVGAYDTDYMIPIDVETVFFTLAQSKVYSAM